MATWFSGLSGSAKEVFTALVADIIYGEALSKKGGDKEVPERPSTAGHGLGSHIRDSWLSTADDKAAFSLALADLSPAAFSMITEKCNQMEEGALKQFRKIVITLPDHAQRVRMLEGFSKQPPEDWDQIMKVCGALADGQWQKAARILKDWVGYLLPATATTALAADQKAAANIDAMTERLHGFNEKLLARSAQRQAASQVVQPMRGPFGWFFRWLFS